MVVKFELLGALSLAAIQCGNAFMSSNRPAAAGSLASYAPSSALGSSYSPVFDFTLANETTKQKSAESFERIDDAIMGGISQSALRDVPNQEYASWSGVCRLDGGGFCGMRTLPFTVPLNATGYDGVYICCQLASDDEADRRMWKLTVRTDSSRGEQVYQSQFDLQKEIDAAKASGGEWAEVKVPFDSFQLVRGPRLIPNGPKLNVSGGIYQIGMTLSKFKMAVNTTQLENFRDGFFEMRIKEIGFYEEGAQYAASDIPVPDTLSKKEAESKRPLLLKMLLPVAKVFFSEQANRRRSAMRILREERGLSRGQAIRFGVRTRTKTLGLLPSLFKTGAILSIDSFRAVMLNILKIVLVYPLRLIGKTVRAVKKTLGMNVRPSLTE